LGMLVSSTITHRISLVRSTEYPKIPLSRGLFITINLSKGKSEREITDLTLSKRFRNRCVQPKRSS